MVFFFIFLIYNILIIILLIDVRSICNLDYIVFFLNKKDLTQLQSLFRINSSEFNTQTQRDSFWSMSKQKNNYIINIFILFCIDRSKFNIGCIICIISISKQHKNLRNSSLLAETMYNPS